MELITEGMSVGDLSLMVIWHVYLPRAGVLYVSGSQYVVTVAVTVMTGCVQIKPKSVISGDI